MEMIAGRFYVLDQFATDGKPLAGPFDTKAEAEAERIQLNIAEDCYTARYNPQTPSDKDSDND